MVIQRKPRRSALGLFALCLTNWVQADASAPIVRLEVSRPSVIVGEPIATEFVIRNESGVSICAPTPLLIEKGFLPLTAEASADGELVASWESFAGCGAPIDRIMRMGGRCLDEMRPGEEYRVKKLVVFLTGITGMDRENPQPLGPGQYFLEGTIRWDGRWLRTDPIRIDVGAPKSEVDRQAASLVDRVFADFMGDTVVQVGMRDREPSDSVKKILEAAPHSVYSRLVTSRVLVLRAEKLSGTYGANEVPGGLSVKQECSELTATINAHLQTDPNDPLERDLLFAQARLLERTDDIAGLERVSASLRARHPNSSFARAVEDLIARRQTNPER